MRNVSEKVIQKIKSHIFVQKRSCENRAVYEITLKNLVVPDRP